jgi:hypothetical protein
MKYSGIITHFRPDLDACLSVWAAKRIHGDLPVEFAPTGNKEVKEGILYVDMTCGIKEGTSGECAGAYLVSQFPENEREAMSKIAGYVNAVDTGQIKRDQDSELVSLAQTINALKETMSDQEVIEASGKIFDGFLSMGLKRQRAKELAESAEWVESVAITTQPEGEQLYFGVVEFLDRPCDVIVTKIGDNIGAKRIREDIDLTKLDLPDGWFKHPAGFMVQWGDLSGKGTPAKTRSTISAMGLAGMIAEIL